MLVTDVIAVILMVVLGELAAVLAFPFWLLSKIKLFSYKEIYGDEL